MQLAYFWMKIVGFIYLLDLTVEYIYLFSICVRTIRPKEAGHQRNYELKLIDPFDRNKLSCISTY